MAQPAYTYSQSFNEATGHGKALFQSTIGHHPVAAAVAMGGLVFVILILAYNLHKCRKKGGKSSFGIRPGNNLVTGSNNPQWWHGSGDAGYGGSVHRETTPIHHAAFYGSTHREGLEVTPPKTGCPPGTKTLYSPDEGGSLKPYCVPEDYSSSQYKPYSPSTASCKATWDPSATAEAVYLATVGSLQHDSYGEARLQSAINSIYDGASHE
jgi:hypothetical protein